tara:strand:- start:105 stop:1898 length:1794 start_codon:yes stop_codon:yes gene_type:complete
MSLFKVTVLSASLLMALHTDNSHANERHREVLPDASVISVSSEGITRGEQQLVAGDFYHLKQYALGERESILAAMEGDTQELFVWRYHQGRLLPLYKGEIETRVVEDLCFYDSAENSQLSLFLIGGRGGAEQRLLRQDETWLQEPITIRDLNVPYDATACAVDQHQGALYVAESDQAIWAYNAEPEAEEKRFLKSVRAPFGHIKGEIKALSLLNDGRLLALEEMPARLLKVSTDDDTVGDTEAQLVSTTHEYHDISVLSDDRVLVTRESGSNAIEVEVTQGEAERHAPVKPIAQVAATLETDPSPRRGDAIDDPAIWVSPTAPEDSLILGTDKRTGLYVYSMNGDIQQHLDVGRMNNVDVRDNLAVASLRDNNSLQFFAISQSGELSIAQQVSTDLDQIYGLCMGYEANSDRLSVYVNGKSGRILHFWVKSAEDVELVREMSVPSQPEGCVVDDKTQRLFVGEEDAGIWLFDAAVNGSEQGEQIITADDVAEIVPDIEGLALAQYDNETLLFVSSQGSDSYVVFDAAAPYALRKHFRIRTNIDKGIDGASETDGIEVTTRSLGEGFEQGALVVQDGRNRMPEAGQNLKLVPLQTIID